MHRIMTVDHSIEDSGNPRRKYSHRLVRFIRHFLFWIVFLFIYSSRVPGVENNLRDALLQSACYLPVIMAATYFTAEVLFRRLFFRKKFAAFSFLLPIAGILITLLSDAVYAEIVRPIFYPGITRPFQYFIPVEFLETFVSLAFIIAFTVTFVLMSDWYTGEKLKEQLLKEKAEAELSALRNQLNPHFLFNALNNLYGTILKQRNEDALGMLLNISSILDFMLHGAAGPVIPVEREIEIIKKYIDLERIRYGDRLSLSVQIEGDFRGRTLPPLILFPFVENSFKHGASESLDHPWVKLLIRPEGSELFMKLENSKGGTGEKPERRGGIGIGNVRRRLELLYGNNYRLDIEDGKSSFSVVLQIATQDSVIHENPLPARR
jgi:two-component system, LytTR family, sensor kinase